MRETDVWEEILDAGKQRGTLTYEEINEALPSEFFPPDELEDFVGLLQDMGVSVVDCEGASAASEEISGESRSDRSERMEDLVQTYFHSMGNISILTKDEETELARRLDAGRRIIREIITGTKKKTETRMMSMTPRRQGSRL
jgi:RNA polymerase primary sigma factor